MDADPQDALRRLSRLVTIEAARIAVSWPAGAEWLERLADRLRAVADELNR